MLFNNLLVLVYPFHNGIFQGSHFSTFFQMILVPLFKYKEQDHFGMALFFDEISIFITKKKVSFFQTLDGVR